MKPFATKKLKDGSLEIEGWANRAVADRGNELINKEAWMLDNFKKNPVMLFNHDMNKPIGKALACEPMDGGLWVKCKLSKSKDPMVSYVRDLVEEGILNSFSVGFDLKDSIEKDGVTEIKGAELYEVSIVAIPMNQDSTFAVNLKSLEGKDYRAVKTEILNAKGAAFAAGIQAELAKLESSEGFDKPAFLEAICEQAGCSKEDLTSVLAGDKEPSAELTAAFEAAFKPEEKPEEKPPEKPEEKKSTELVAVKVPKSQFETTEEASAWAEEQGWKGGIVEEEGDFYVIYQVDPTEFGELEEVEADGIVTLIGERKACTKQAGQGGASVSANEVQKVDDNPHLAEMRQLNNQMAQLLAKFDSLVEVLTAIYEKEKIEEVEEMATEQDAESLQKYLDTVDKKFKSLGL